MHLQDADSADESTYTHKVTRAEAIQWALSLEDQLGLKLDQGILSSVAGLHMHGVETSQSCEGHPDHGLPYPWIDIAPSSKPRLEQLLQEEPLPGFALQSFRLLPAQAAGLNPFSVIANIPPDCKAIPNPEARKELLENLSQHQIHISSWGEQLLLP